MAENGAVAVDKVASTSYDLVLMDMQMPVLDGLTATREIRQLPAGKDLPIVAMTANAMTGDRERCLEAGMNDHLAKPIDPDLLWTTLAQWIPPRVAPSPSAVKVSTPVPVDVMPPEMAGFDPVLGLHQVMGHEVLYRSILGKFITNYRDFPAQIAASLARNDIGESERLAHTLKGNAAQIGATAMRELAEQLEHAIRCHESSEKLSALLKEVDGSLAALQHPIAKKRTDEAR